MYLQWKFIWFQAQKKKKTTSINLNNTDLSGIQLGIKMHTY